MTRSGSNNPAPPDGPATAASRGRSFVGRRKALGRALVALFVLVAAGVVITYRLASRPATRTSERSQPLPPNAQQQLSGYSFTRSEGGHQIFTVRARRTLTLKGGQSTTLSGVEIEIFGRTGRQHDVLRTEQCEYNSGVGNFSCAGAVEIELNARPASEAMRVAATGSSDLGGRQTVFLQTSALSYDQNSSMLTTAAPVQWRYGPASGSAIGLAYSTQDGWIEFTQAVAAILPLRALARDGEPATLRLQAARAHYASNQQQIDLVGPVSLWGNDRRMAAGHAIISLNSQNRPTSALLDGGVRVSDGNPAPPISGKAATITARFDPSTGDLRKIEAGGGVQAWRGSGPGSSRLTADRMEVNLQGTHFHPSQGTASGNVHIEAQSQTRGGASPPQRASAGLQASCSREELDAAEVEFTLRPADGTLDRAQTAGPGKLVLVPADPKAGRRLVTAGRFLANFDGKSRLESVRGLAPTRVVFEPAQGKQQRAGPMESDADNLQAAFDPASTDLRSVVQSGRFQFIDADARATADRAEYSADGGVLALTGTPQLWNPDSRMRADRFVLHLETDAAEGIDHVASSHIGPADFRSSPSSESPEPSGPEGPGAKAARDSAAGKTSGAAAQESQDVTNVIADRVMADRRKQFVRYEGHVRAWRSSDALESPSLDIYTTERRIVSGSPVLTSDLAPAPSLQRQVSPFDSPPAGAAGRRTGTSKPPQATPATPSATQPVTIQADGVEYSDLTRKAIYRGHVRMISSGATLQADQLEAYFTQSAPAEASKLQRAEADGRVTVVEPGRRATGDRAEYFAATGKIVMTGGPPTLYDSEKGFVTGRSLTFSVLNDSLLIDGGPGSRTMSKHRLSQ